MFSIHNNNFLQKITYLDSIPVNKFIQVSKRTMMAAGTKITMPETIQQKKLLSLLLRQLRENPLSEDKLLSLLEASAINVKLFQNMVHVVFPDATFPLEMVQQKYPGIKIGLVNNDTLSWNDVISVHIAFIAKKHGTFPVDSNLYVLGTPPYDSIKGDTSNNLQAIANTGQKNPDYFLVHKDWTRYYDFKSGQYSSMKGHIIVRNNRDVFEQTTKDVMYHQLQFFVEQGDRFNDVVIFIKGLIGNNTLDWAQKSKSLQNYYFSIMDRLPAATPSIIFQYEPLYEHEHMPSKYYNNIPVKPDSCQNKQGIYDILTEAFILDKSGKLFGNYQKSHGVSKAFLAMKRKVISEVLSEFLS